MYVHRPSRPARLFFPLHHDVWVMGLVGDEFWNDLVPMARKRLLRNFYSVNYSNGGKRSVQNKFRWPFLLVVWNVDELVNRLIKSVF